MYLAQKVWLYNRLLFCLLTLIIFMFFGYSVALSNEPDPRYIMNKVQEKYDGIEDYSTTMKVEVDIPNFRIPQKEIKIYYKKPDKLSMKTSGFAILPRWGVLPLPSDFLKEGAKLEYNCRERIDEVSYHVVDVISVEKKQPDVDISIWVNSKRWTIDKVVSSNRAGKFEMKFSYVKIDNFWLPDTTIIEINFAKGIPEMHRPSMRGSFERDLRDNIIKEGNINGRVVVAFSNFLVNIGLDDTLFEGKK